MSAPQGYVALDLVGFTDKGDYAAGSAYVKNDLVHSDNKIYLSLQDNNTGQALPVSPETETAFWKLWLSGGADSLELITAKDTGNLTGGGAGTVVVAQELIDAIVEKYTELNSDLNSVSDGLNLLTGINTIDDCNNAGEPQKLTVHRYGEDTLNSPYKAGLTSNASAGFLFTMKNSVNYGIQVAYVCGSYNSRGYILSRGLNGENSWLEWHPVTPYSNRQTSIAANYGLSLNITKVANTVTLSIYGRLTGIEAGTEYTIYTLPEEYRPFYSQYWNTYVAQSGNYAPFLVSANADGSVKLNCTGGEVPTGYISIRYVYGIDY